MSKIQITIEGMTCGHCEMSVNKELAAVAGVTGVKVDHKSGTAEVETDGSVSEQSLSDAVSEAGYTATEFVNA